MGHWVAKNFAIKQSHGGNGRPVYRRGDIKAAPTQAQAARKVIILLQVVVNPGTCYKFAAAQMFDN